MITAYFVSCIIVVLLMAHRKALVNFTLLELAIVIGLGPITLIYLLYQEWKRI